MLNYSAIIRSIINQYKKRKKYIFSFLLLSVFVTWVVSSVLTKPAMSLTNDELSDEFIQLQDVKSIDNMDDLNDVIPTINTQYTDSFLRDYMSHTSTILGEASRFHLFAFSNIIINSHCNGNFAAPEVTLNSDFGTKQIANAGGDEVSVITNKINGNIKSYDNVLLIPESYQVTSSDESQTGQNMFSNVNINNMAADFPNGKTSLYRVTDDFIDFGAEKDRYIRLSGDISDYESTDNVILDTSDINNAFIRIADNSENEINVLNLKALQLTSLQGILKIMTNGQKPLIINVDMNGCGELFEQNFKTVVMINGNTLDNDETNIQYGSNILWNYYDSSADDKSYTGTIKFQKSLFGCILSPAASIQTNQAADGNIIADSISIYGESHKMMFMTGYDIENGEPSLFTDEIYTPKLFGAVGYSGNIDVAVQVMWADGNQNHTDVNQCITVQLYKAPVNTDINNLQPSQQVSGGTAQINSNNNWKRIWYGMQINDNEAYYIKEISSPFGCTFTYQNNGLTQAGTIILNNSMNGSGGGSGGSSKSINVTVRKNWSDGNDRHSSDQVRVNLYKAPKGSDINSLSDSQRISEETLNNYTSPSWYCNKNIQIADNEAVYIKETYTSVQSQVTYQNNGISDSGTIMLTNTPNGSGGGNKSINVTFRKVWSDGNDNHSGDQVRINIYKAPKGSDINSLSDSQKISEETLNNYTSPSWSCSKNIQIADNEAIYAKETYSSVSAQVTYQNNGISDSGTITITGTLNGSGGGQSDKVNITVNVNWVECSAAGNASFSIYRSHTLSTTTIPNDKVLADGCSWIYISGNESWSVKKTDLQASENGSPWYYYVQEDAVNYQQSELNNYDITYSAYGMCSADSTVTITNTKKGATSFTLEVQKKWEGSNDYNKDVTVKLQRSTDNSSWTDVQNCVLNSSNSWRNTFTSIPKKDGGNIPYYYRVREVSVPVCYYDTYSVDSIDASTVNGSVRIEITNTLKKSSLKIQKFWEGVDPETILNDADDVKVSVYRRAVSAPAVPRVNMYSMDKVRAFNSNSGVLSGNVLTLPGGSFGPMQYANNKYEIYYDLSSYAGSTVSKVEVTLSTVSGSQCDGGVRGGQIEDYGGGYCKIKPDAQLPLFAIFNEWVTYSGNTFTYQPGQSFNYSTEHFNNWTLDSDSALILTHTDSYAPSYTITNVKITFGSIAYNPGVTTTAATTTTPKVTTTKATTTTTKAPVTTPPTTTTAAPVPVLVQPDNRTIPAGCELCTVVTLNDSNNWQKVVDDLPMGDGKGNVYEYYIVETMIDLKDGSTHNYMIQSYSQDDGLQLSEYPDENLLSVTNIPYTTTVKMPSTGGITAEVYYKTGLMMIITSGGLYISLVIEKKRKTSKSK